MPSFVYLGLPEKQQKAIVESTMKPLESDFGPHPRFGGFPEKHDGNPPIYYPSRKDGPAEIEAKRKRREEYRLMRLKELEKEIAQMDSVYKYGGTEFKKNEPVELPEDHPMLVGRVSMAGGSKKTYQPKMAILIDSGVFKEVTGSSKSAKPVDSEDEPAKKKPGRPKKAKPVEMGDE